MRKGLTLIELLIVVAIIAILAGGAIPYVQRYVEESRISRAKADLTEIRNALSLYEMQRDSWQDADTTMHKLVGPYLSKNLIDPWGRSYFISNQKSLVISFGPDGTLDGGDDIALAFRPPMALAKAVYRDKNGDGQQSLGDEILLICTRPLNAVRAGTGASLSFERAGGGWLSGNVVLDYDQAVIRGKQVTIPLTDPAGWGGGLLQPNGRVSIVQIPSHEVLEDRSGEPTRWAKNSNSTPLQFGD